MIQFTLYTLSWYFMIYAILGWCTEVGYAALNQGKFVNRGFLNGPACPIYGFGVLLVLNVLMPVRNSLLLVFLGAVVLTSALEWITGFVLEKVFHDKWWDYSDMPFNVNGYICLKFSVMWGLACVLIVEIVHPAVANLVGFIPVMAGQVLVSGLLLTLAIDTGVTVATILNLNKELSAMREITGALRETSELLGHGISEGVLELEDKRHELRLELEARRAEFEERRSRLKDEVGAELFYRQLEVLNRYEELTERYNRLADRRRAVWDRMLKAFPNITSNYYREELEEIKERYRKFLELK